MIVILLLLSFQLQCKIICMCLYFMHAYFCIFFRLSWTRCIWAACTLPPWPQAQLTWATGFRAVRPGHALAPAMLAIMRQECNPHVKDAHMPSLPSLRCTSLWREKPDLGAAMSCLWLVWFIWFCFIIGKDVNDCQ